MLPTRQKSAKTFRGDFVAPIRISDCNFSENVYTGKLTDPGTHSFLLAIKSYGIAKRGEDANDFPPVLYDDKARSY